MSKTEILQILKEFKIKNKERYQFKRIGLFGSVARGDSTGSSDIDIVIEQENPDLFLLGDIKSDLEELFGRHVDIVRMRENMNPYLFKRIKRDVVYV
jgi:predicted nucleotidyltransferase